MGGSHFIRSLSFGEKKSKTEFTKRYFRFYSKN